MKGMSIEEVINQVFGGGGHVVILGSGASIASTLDNPELNGKKLPSMDNLIEIIGLSHIAEKVPEALKHKNFEKLYSNLYKSGKYPDVLSEIEEHIHEYFGNMQLSEKPTIYDYLVLSLRGKDLIATFNWDPFLYQAWVRNSEFTDDLPHIAFLHGNVAIGYNSIEKISGPNGYQARKDGGIFFPTQLLYPIEHKDYNSDEYIKTQWEIVTHWLSKKSSTVRATIFGYSAPETDVEAVTLLNDAWGNPDDRAMEQFEIIDIVPEKELRNRWKGFIHSHHYDVVSDYFDSSLALNPRRTSESYFSHYEPLTPSEAFRLNNPIPRNLRTLEDLWAWHKPLLQAENKARDEAEKKHMKATTPKKSIKNAKKKKPRIRTNNQIVERWKKRKRKKKTRIRRN